MKENITYIYNSIISWTTTHGFKIAIIILGTYVLNKIIYRFISKIVRITVVADKNSSKEAEFQREDTIIHIFTSTIRVAIFVTAGLMILEEVGLMITPILASVGIIGLAFGFGGQYLIRDLISGLFIILENQYRIGDMIKFESISGIVEEITLRKTTIRDMDGTVHHIPHGEIKYISNFSKDFARVNFEIGVAYKSNLEHVISVINRVGNELFEDTFWKEAVIEPPQFLRVNNFADSAIMIKIVGDTKPLRQMEVTGELRKRLKIAFDKEGIEIPFPQSVIHQIQ